LTLLETDEGLEGYEDHPDVPPAQHDDDHGADDHDRPVPSPVEAVDVAQALGTLRAPTSELCQALHLRVETLLEQLFFTTLYIETSYADGRKASGTGFVYNVHVGGG